ncbi:MAG: hypothetical protein NVV66_16280 [Cellulomonas sp.]|uniref:hypothetical protein n=1 Tax=Cellulomonas sp. TaxID=40001 RepID=UPI0025904FB7|nr:hypothetical protein [Cellulomonas sp.]MCR6706175.1 hypothetical protein [Cellulomonas sp.]
MTALVVPPAPTQCVVSGITTRSATVTVTPAAMTSTATAYTVSGGTKAAGASKVTFSGAATAKAKGVDGLLHGVKHSFAATTSNATGAGPSTSCSGTTPLVQVSVSAAPSGVGSVAAKTRTVVAKVTSSNATVQTPSVARTSGAGPASGEDLGAMSKCAASSTTHCTVADSWRADPLLDGVAYRVTGSASDGVNASTATATASTDALDTPSITVGTRTTRKIAASFTAGNGSAGSSSIGLTGLGYTDGRSATRDPLTDGTAYTVTARISDGFNTVAATKATSTTTLSTPSTPACVASLTDSTAPGRLTISGGDQVRLGTGGTGYSNSATYSTLAAGTYVGYARDVASDGHNYNYSAWDACPSATVKAAAPSTPSSIAVGGYTPSLGYIAFTTANAADASSFTIQAPLDVARDWPGDDLRRRDCLRRVCSCSRER